VTNDDLAGSAVSGPKIANKAVDSSKIADGQVLNADLGYGAVNESKVQYGSLTGFSIQNRGLSDSDIGSPAQVPGADIPPVPAQGCIPLQLNFPSWTQIGELVFASAADGALGPSGLIITPLVVTVSGSAFGRICNVTTTARDPAAEDILAWSIQQ
jgi:hypothetical protein